ncbi:TerC family protein [Lysinibacillus sp. LZ02]|uniref:TerC family protein n=1 Tax=Lysinibacillus sp. LZ02 TaxID=3420668 RepID=UPI003D36504E
MDIMTTEFLTALLSIIVIDLVLAGDNALLIGLVAKNLPKKQQKKVILIGTFGAICVRVLLTLVAVRLLEIDGLLLVGGVLLVYIAYKLLLNEEEIDVKPSEKSFWGAVGTILLADILMGVDNIIGVAGAAHGNFLLVVIGLFISIPIVVWGSTIVIKLIELFPFIIYMGAGILAWTASKMIMKDAYVAPFFQSHVSMFSFELLVVATVLFTGYITRHRLQKAKVATR